jgi:hypothetical protein
MFVQCTFYIIHTTQYTVYSIQYTVYSRQYTVYTMQEKIAALHTAASEGNLKLLQTLANKKLMAAKVGQIISSFLCLGFMSSLKDGDFRVSFVLVWKSNLGRLKTKKRLKK